MDNHEQFTRRWTEAQPIVAGYINALVPDFQEAEDLLQEVAVILLRKFSEYDAQRPFVAWAIGVAKREVLMARRHHARSFLSYQADLLERIGEAYEELAPEFEDRSRALHECLRSRSDVGFAVHRAAASGIHVQSCRDHDCIHEHAG